MKVKDLDINLIRKLPKGKSVWYDSWLRFKKDWFGMLCLVIVVLYIVIAVLSLSGLLEYVFVYIDNFFNFIGIGHVFSKEFLQINSWNAQAGGSYNFPSLSNLLGTDILGRSVLRKILLGAGISMFVGLITATTSVLIGTLIGSIAGYIGGIIDEIIVWIYSTVSSVPYILLITALAYTLGKGLVSVCFALALTNWVYTARLVRGEVLKHKNREYVTSAKAVGAGHIRRLFYHILPNIIPLVLINFSLRFVGAIKAEVILSYLGVGAQNIPSWGIMIADSREEIVSGVWWQLIFTTLAMFIVLLAFNTVTDLLRDAWDPKLKGSK